MYWGERYLFYLVVITFCMDRAEIEKPPIFFPSGGGARRDPGMLPASASDLEPGYISAMVLLSHDCVIYTTPL